eukprot:CAMPEP_0198107960 /NCGR_PEP_ID=MMETSP1442-20131203/52_1 /TAXON_ID= /ORGANISM="Craspedostauros australis, Strain CCMP3328" /LENGTH=409 /DNA_ID=CAMNT_0043763139 /DNA_START=45 /DNA_END=1271 /DNA_ORIENTATION=-
MTMMAARKDMFLQPSWMSAESYGLLLLLLNGLLFALMGMFLKLCSNSGIPSTELVLMRSLVQGFFVLILLCQMKPISVAQGGPHYDHVVTHNAQVKAQADDDEAGTSTDLLALLPQRPLLFTPFGGTWDVQRLVIVRGIAGGVGFIMYFATMKLLPLGDAMTLLSFTPIFTIFLAAFFLREPILLSHIMATCFSFAGAVFIAHPTFIFGSDGSHAESSASQYGWVGYLTAILGSFCGAAAMTLIRGAGKIGAHTLHLLASFVFFGLISAIAFGQLKVAQRLDGLWYVPSQPDIWFYVFAMGMTGTSAHFLMNFAVQLAPAGLGSIVRSSNIVWAYIFEIIIFEEVPRFTTWIGVACVVTSLSIIAFQKVQDEQQKMGGTNEQSALLDDNADAESEQESEWLKVEGAQYG